MGAVRNRGRKNGARLRHGARRPVIAAAIDLGTNNCRLLIGAGENGGLRILDSYSRIVRLGEGVTQTGALSLPAIERTVAALKVCAERLRKNNVTHIRAIATQACRTANNAQLLLDRVREEAGIALDIISAEEEARIAAAGCAPLMGADHDGALIFDIGGGSTELIWMKKGAQGAEVKFLASIPAGVVSLSERFGGEHANFAELSAELTPLFARIAADMARAGTFPAATHHLLGTSGTVTTLAAIALGLPRYDRKRVDASWHDSAAIRAIVERIVALDHKARARLACVGPDRADLMLPGCAIFSAIHAQWPCARLRVADRGLREGMLRELIGLSA